MNEIKTKSAIKDIKVLDKTTDVTQRAKNAFVRTKEQVEQTQQPSHGNYVEYAGDKLKDGSQTVAQNAGHTVQHQGKSAIQRTRGELAKRGYTRSRARQTTRTGGKTAKKTVKGTIKIARKSIKTASSTAKTAIKTSRTAVKTAAKTAQATVKATQRAVQAARVATRVAIMTAKVVIKAIIATIKAIVAAVKGLISLIVAGGWVAVVIIIVIALIAFLLASPLGIFTGGGADNTPTISDVIQTLNGELTVKISQIQKDAGTVDKVVVSFINDDNSFIDNWPDILAVFAVQTNMNSQNPIDVVVMDEQRVTQLRKVFWDMNTVASDISETTPASTHTASQSPESTATPAPLRILTINVASKYWDDMTSVYHFDEAQISMLKELMGARYAGMLMQLVDSAIGKPATDWSSIIDVPKGGMPIPLYFQFDYPQTICYIDGVAKSVKTSGCGATSVSMVITYLTGNTSQTPYTLFKWAYNNGYYTGDGLGHSCLTKLASLYGVKGVWIENDAAQITAALKAGHPVVAHMGPGIFTSGGHYIVLRGITDDGYVLVNDPGSRNKNKYAYKLSAVVAQTKTSKSFMVCE